MNMDSYSCCKPGSSASESIKALSGLLKLIGEESRLGLLCILRDGEHCVCEFAEHLSDLSQSLISHHLADLKAAGLIVSRKQGLRVYYKLSERGEQIVGKVFALQTTTNEKVCCSAGGCAKGCAQI